MPTSDLVRVAVRGVVMAAALLAGLALLRDVHGWGEVVLSIAFGTVGAGAELVRRRRARRQTGVRGRRVPDSRA